SPQKFPLRLLQCHPPHEADAPRAAHRQHVAVRLGLGGVARELAAGAVAGDESMARARGKVWHIGYLGYGGPGSDPSRIEGLRQGWILLALVASNFLGNSWVKSGCPLPHYDRVCDLDRREFPSPRRFRARRREPASATPCSRVRCRNLRVAASTLSDCR